MTQAQKCPVCEGKGVVANPFGDKKCHGCGGKGWVVVGVISISPELLCTKFESTSLPRKSGFQYAWDDYCEGKV